MITCFFLICYSNNTMDRTGVIDYEYIYNDEIIFILMMTVFILMMTIFILMMTFSVIDDDFFILMLNMCQIIILLVFIELVIKNVLCE